MHNEIQLVHNVREHSPQENNICGFIIIVTRMASSQLLLHISATKYLT